jgi:hypothetical protein
MCLETQNDVIDAHEEVTCKARRRHLRRERQALDESGAEGFVVLLPLGRLSRSWARELHVGHARALQMPPLPRLRQHLHCLWLDIELWTDKAQRHFVYVDY